MTEDCPPQGSFLEYMRHGASKIQSYRGIPNVSGISASFSKIAIEVLKAGIHHIIIVRQQRHRCITRQKRLAFLEHNAS